MNKMHYLDFIEILLNASLFTINGLKYAQSDLIVVYVYTKIVWGFFCSSTFIWQIIHLWNDILQLSFSF